MKFFTKDFFSKCDHIRSFLLIWSHLLKKSLMENFIFSHCMLLVLYRDSEQKIQHYFLFDCHYIYCLNRNSKKCWQCTLTELTNSTNEAGYQSHMHMCFLFGDIPWIVWQYSSECFVTFPGMFGMNKIL